MAKTLSPNTIALVKATVPALQAHGLDIVREMYSRMFQNPAIRDLFNQSHHSGEAPQQRALAMAILAYGSNIENLGALAGAVERIAQKHVGLQILPEHYPYVAEALLGAIKAVLGDAATDEVLAAWGEAYWFLADILINREAQIYQEVASAEGGWTGWRDFTVEEVRPESAIIKSFVLRPVDGKPVVRHKPGQYLTFWLSIPGQPAVKRNYSISSAPNGETYRISVKREPNGLASGWMHGEVKPGTVLKVGAPAGDFYVDGQPERPLVLLSGGVGLTPMVSMFETATANRWNVPLHFIHGTQDGSTHALGNHVRALAGNHDNAQVSIFYDKPRVEDVAGRHYDEAGLISQAWLGVNTPVESAEYYLCGPKPFMRAMVSALGGLGVEQNRIHYEFFGPADEVLAA